MAIKIHKRNDNILRLLVPMGTMTSLGQFHDFPASASSLSEIDPVSYHHRLSVSARLLSFPSHNPTIPLPVTGTLLHFFHSFQSYILHLPPSQHRHLHSSAESSLYQNKIIHLLQVHNSISTELMLWSHGRLTHLSCSALMRKKNTRL